MAVRPPKSKLEIHREIVAKAVGDLRQLGYQTSILQAAVNKLKQREKKRRELSKLKLQVERLEQEMD